jgi:hypothetical protein
MMRRFLRSTSMVAMLFLFGLLPPQADAASVTLSALTGTGESFGDGVTKVFSFTLPTGLTSINSFQLDFEFFTNTTTDIGDGVLQGFLEQDTAAIPGRSAFAFGETTIGHGSVFNWSASFNAGDSSYTLTPGFLTSQFNFGTLSSTGLWDDSAGSTFNLYYYASASSGATNVEFTATKADLILDYNTSGGGGAIPEPSTLAIALVGLAGWRGRRLLRRS